MTSRVSGLVLEISLTWLSSACSCIVFKTNVREHDLQVWGVTFSKDGEFLASVSDDKGIGMYSYSS